MGIDFANIYTLEEAFKRGAFRPSVLDYAEMEHETLREYHRGQRRPLKPLQLSWAEGSRLMDFTGTTAVLPDVISQHFVDVLRDHDVTGWSTYPVELRGRDGALIEGYYGLVVTGHSGPLQLERSRSEIRVGPTGNRYKAKVGLYFDEASWDGNDMFTPADTSFVFVVDKVKRLLEQAKINNISFTSLNTLERQ